MITEIPVADLTIARQAGALLIDVREPDEYEDGHVPGAVSMPLGVLPVRTLELPKDSPVYVICQMGGRSMQAAMFLDRAGYDARSVAGGTNAWISAGHPLATGRAMG